jgi:hypothetical protein
VLSESNAGGSQHRAGGSAFWFRLTDNLFRRIGWWLLPIVAFTALGVSQAGNTLELYRSGATLSAVENPLVNSPVVGAATQQWWETPASATSRIINEQLRTDSFITKLAESAGLGDAIDQGFITNEIVRASIWATPTGDGILSVNATWADPQTSFELVSATIDEYQNYITESVASDAAEAVEFYSQQLESAMEERAAAERDLTEFIADFVGDESASDQPVIIQIEIDRLRNRVTAAEAKVAAAQASIEEAQLQVAQQTTRAGRTFSVIDQPSVPRAPMSTMLDRITTIGSYFVLGAVVAGAALLVTTALDRSVSSSADLLALNAVSLVATVPRITLTGTPRRRHSRNRRRAKKLAT